MPISGNQIDKLSERLRESETPADSDLRLLEEFLIEHNGALEAVVSGLASIGQEATVRLKTSGTIVDKLRRESPITLRGIRDLAGARIVKPMTLDEQDELGAKILEIWPTARRIDRRAEPTHGYRALHLVPRIDRCTVEIQIRTYFQDTWAQTMEWYGDIWGRDIRYGGDPEDPDELLADGATTRRQMIQGLKGMSDSLYAIAQRETKIATLKKQIIALQPCPEKAALTVQIRELEEQANLSLEPVRISMAKLRQTVAKAN